MNVKRIKHNGFARTAFGTNGGTYRCRVCHGRTRNVGGDAAPLKLCEECFELAGEDNAHNDDGTVPTVKQALRYVLLLDRIAQRDGADVQRVKDANPYLFHQTKPRYRWMANSGQWVHC